MFRTVKIIILTVQMYGKSLCKTTIKKEVVAAPM